MYDCSCVCVCVCLSVCLSVCVCVCVRGGRAGEGAWVCANLSVGVLASLDGFRDHEEVF